MVESIRTRGQLRRWWLWPLPVAPAPSAFRRRYTFPITNADTTIIRVPTLSNNDNNILYYIPVRAVSAAVVVTAVVVVTVASSPGRATSSAGPRKFLSPIIIIESFYWSSRERVGARARDGDAFECTAIAPSRTSVVQGGKEGGHRQFQRSDDKSFEQVEKRKYRDNIRDFFFFNSCLNGMIYDESNNNKQ